MSLHIRRTLEQAYLQNLKNRDIQVITVSLEDQAEVRNDFNILCEKKGISNPIRIQLTPEDYFAPLSPILYIINELLSRNGIELTQVSKLLKLGCSIPCFKTVLIFMNTTCLLILNTSNSESESIFRNSWIIFWVPVNRYLSASAICSMQDRAPLTFWWIF